MSVSVLDCSTRALRARPWRRNEVSAFSLRPELSDLLLVSIHPLFVSGPASLCLHQIWLYERLRRSLCWLIKGAFGALKCVFADLEILNCSPKASSEYEFQARP